MKHRGIYCILSFLFISVFLPDVKPRAQESYWESITLNQQYFDAFETADSALFTREFEYPFLLLLNDAWKQWYDSLPSLDKRKDLIREYWKQENPNPIDDENPWLTDFIERNKYVKKFFRRDKIPYFDDRGKYWLKYGKPVRRYSDHRTSFYLGRQFLSKFQDETWSYEDIYPDLVIHFQKDFSYFAELPPYRTFGEGRRGELINRTLLQERLHVSPLIREIIQDYGFQAMYMFANRQKTAFENAPAAVPSKEKKHRKLEFHRDIAQFRGPAGGTRVEISFQAPFNKNLIRKASPSSEDTLTIEFSSILRDINFEPVIKVRNTRRYPVSSAAKAKLPNAVNILSFISPPQPGELTMQIRNVPTDSIGYFQQFLHIRDFSSDDLMISDLQIYSQVDDPEQQKVVPYKVMEGFVTAPYLHTEERRSEPLLVYYELYNLLNGKESAEYDFNIEVEWDEARYIPVKKLFDFFRGKDRYTVSFTQKRTFARNTVREIIMLDLSNLEEGPYNLTLTVTDTSNEGITVSAVKDIDVVE